MLSYKIIDPLATYKSVHLDPRNIATHCLGIPLIVWGVMLLLSHIQLGIFSLATWLLVPILTYYFFLHIGLAIGMSIALLGLLYSTSLVIDSPYSLWLGTGALIMGWIWQFVGHYFEGAKPAFVDDLKQLLIGPLFLMAELYFALGLQQDMAEAVLASATKKRQLFKAVNT